MPDGSTEGLPAGLLGALAAGEAYPEDASAAAGVEHVQTHLSHVFLTGARVYKLRKPVDLGFVDFRRREERYADCVREVALNRRLAPDVYLGVARIEPLAGSFRVGPIDSDPSRAPEASHHEPCVVMRRLLADRDALSLLERGALRSTHLDTVAALLAGFHARVRLGVPAPFSAAAWRDRTAAPVEANLALLGDAPEALLPSRLVDRLAERVRRFLEQHLDRFEARRRRGCAVDGHGDLHLQHIWFEQDEAPLLIDCLEFREDLRRIDAASDVAFLAMDLTYRDRWRLSERFVRRYARDSDDFDLYGVLAYYASYRAAVRAKVAAIAAGDAGLAGPQRSAAGESARRHLALAVRLLDPPRAGALVVTCGVVGTGKTFVAERIADELGGVVISSDRVRKHLAGVAATERGPSEIYEDQRTEEVYEGLLERAAPVAASGRLAILDATFAQERHRTAARRWASERGLPFRLVETRCAEDTARRRLAAREEAGRDASDAGPDFLSESVRRFEPVRNLSAEEHWVLYTDRPDSGVAERELLRELGALLEPNPPHPEDPCSFASSSPS